MLSSKETHGSANAVVLATRCAALKRVSALPRMLTLAYQIDHLVESGELTAYAVRERVSQLAVSPQIRNSAVAADLVCYGCKQNRAHPLIANGMPSQDNPDSGTPTSKPVGSGQNLTQQWMVTPVATA